ncbi:MAG: DUF3106 domain-containing protein [Rhodoferax sp.]|uniref:DUF3106 domain-containing protein n=1 Tax=Rhodoferax sp. TaxID=50421 RepID=UPI00260842B0|nr:DUF3106 domain-containing protein [Rhodoferax sp.]MDD5335710.1 DUF3106 domain-containing protein [Rhodoferax sp.]
MTMFRSATDQRNHRLIAGVSAFGVAVFLLAVLSAPTASALAQAATTTPLLTQSYAKTPASGTQAKRSSVQANSSRPSWQDLTPLQQLSLKPLAANWSTLGEAQKRKWIAIAQNYPNLAPTEQAKLHSRMTEWVSLSQQQRNQARLNFAQTKQLTPSQKTATWKAYQALTPEERQKLAVSAASKPGGAATAAKPVPRQKLAVVPVTRHTHQATPKLAGTNHAVNHNTLLPQSLPPAEAAPTQKN